MTCEPLSGRSATRSARSSPPTVIRMSDRFRDLAAANREAFSQKFASVAERLAETIEKIDFEGIASAVLTVADYAIRAFNAVGGFNTVLYAMGAIMAGRRS